MSRTESILTGVLGLSGRIDKSALRLVRAGWSLSVKSRIAAKTGISDRRGAVSARAGSCVSRTNSGVWDVTDDKTVVFRHERKPVVSRSLVLKTPNAGRKTVVNVTFLIVA